MQDKIQPKAGFSLWTLSFSLESADREIPKLKSVTATTLILEAEHWWNSRPIFV